MGIIERGLSAMENLCVFHRKCIKSRSVFGSLHLTWLVCIVLVDFVGGYNLDLETRTVHTGAQKSMFGYTVALHQDQGSYW